MATKNDIVIYQGATFSTIIKLVDNSNNPVSLAGYTPSSQMKKWYSSLTAVSFQASINATAGSITLALPAIATANIVHGRYVYDINITDSSNNVNRVAEGIVTVLPGVTNIAVETTTITYNPNTDFVVIPLSSNTP